MIPVYFLAELSVSLLCLVTSGVLLAVGRALIKYLKSKTERGEKRRESHR